MKTPGPHRGASYPSASGLIPPGFFHAAGGLRAAGPFDGRESAITPMASAPYDDGARGPVAAGSREARRRKARPSARNTTAPAAPPIAWPRMSLEVA